MPLYEYVCDNGHRFELIVKFSDPPLEKCPTCGAPVQKLMSSPAIQFKGTGWYITDYAKKDHTPASKTGDPGSGANAKESSGAAGGGESSTKSDSAAKSEKSSGSSDSSSSSSSTTTTPSGGKES